MRNDRLKGTLYRFCGRYIIPVEAWQSRSVMLISPSTSLDTSNGSREVSTTRKVSDHPSFDHHRSLEDTCLILLP